MYPYLTGKKVRDCQEADMHKIKIMLVDDHAVFREGLRAFLGECNDIEIIGEASDGREALEKFTQLSPDVVVMDLCMPQMDGLEATRRIIEKNPSAKVLVLTQYDDPEHIVMSIKAGASGYLPKHAPGPELISAIHIINDGQAFLEPDAALVLMKDCRNGKNGRTGLTAREREVLKLAVQGNTSRQIADRLRIGLKTVLGHRSHMMKKLSIKNQSELVRYAIRTNMFEMDF
jgi:two-component system, NarL family, response regulator NreC